MRPRRRCGCPVLLAGAMLVACQPLPHPFADDRPPESLLRVRDSAGISIAPIEGGPFATAQKLGAAVASALVKRDIPASDRTTNLTSYLLYGELEPQRPHADKAVVTAHWRLRDATGHPVGERTTQFEAPARAWESGDDKIIAALAETSATEIAPMLAEEAPPQAAAATNGGGDGRIRIAIRPVSGAPGDGSKSLANAVAIVLKRQELTVVEDPSGKADVTLDGEVSVAPVKPDKQHIKIVWHVRRADGAEVGTVGQENDVPKGMLDGPWGDIAYSVAIAGADGLIQVIARAAPDGKS